MRVTQGIDESLGLSLKDAPLSKSKPAEPASAKKALAAAARDIRKLNSKIVILQTQLKDARQENADLRNTILILNAHAALFMSDKCAWIYVQ
jgi:hypothetical protein